MPESARSLWFALVYILRGESDAGGAQTSRGFEKTK